RLSCQYGLLKAARKSGKLNLSSLSPAISEMKNSRMLDCSRNQTESIPPVLTQMESLEQLYLRHNKLRFLSRTELHCGNNQIEVLEADHLKHLSALSFLDLPCGLGTLPKLKSLILEANPLRTILSALQKGTGELLKYLRKQPDGSLKEEPKTATTLPSQAKINVHAIKTLKTQDYRLKKIIINEVFDAVHIWPFHLIRSVSDLLNTYNAYLKYSLISCRILELKDNLADINLGFNKLTTIPVGFSKVKHLHLDFRNNLLISLPVELEGLTKLQSSFPEMLNQVGGIDPVQMKTLNRLCTLDLSNNDILQVPPELGDCTSLRALMLEGNPFRNPRAAILSKGTDAVLEYLRSRIPT
uniref:Leucine rich repeat containing 40 n=1 Tax=Cyprinus carpio carpio TaxID=630221 RepID=A0A8C1HEP3_CYPCA